MLAAGMWWAQAFAESSGIESRTYDIREGDPREAEAAVKQVLSPEGRTVLLIPQRRMLVQDRLESFEMVEAIMAVINAPRPNVRVEVVFDESGESRQRGVDVRGRSGRWDIGAHDQRTTTSRSSAPFLVVRSGNTSSIRVAQEVPFIDYFYQSALGYGLVTAEVRWESIGTQLAVTPQVRGDLIELELFPRITALVAGQWQTIDYRELATRVTVANGQSVQVGGFSGANAEFNRNFFRGVGSDRSTMSSSFTVRASVMSLPGR